LSVRFVPPFWSVPADGATFANDSAADADDEPDEPDDPDDPDAVAPPSLPAGGVSEQPAIATMETTAELTQSRDIIMSIPIRVQKSDSRPHLRRARFTAS
jgi:hypothetical protein